MTNHRKRRNGETRLRSASALPVGQMAWDDCAGGVGFSPSRLFLTGEEQDVKQVWQNFGVRVDRKARGLIDRAALTGVIDRAGTLRFAYHGTAPQAKTMLQDIRSLLARPPNVRYSVTCRISQSS